MLGNIKQNLFRSWVDLGNTIDLSHQEIERTWTTLVSFYQEPHRAYHNLNHLSQMFELTEKVLPYISEPISFKLAIWFHDIIYKPTKKNNESSSAQKAEIFMRAWNLPEETILFTTQYIQATAKHQPINGSNDEQLFLDIDLSILGREPYIYRAYIHAIRKEYKMYPTLIYNYGRRKIIKKFLERPRIYFSDIMYERFEDQARMNMVQELEKMK